MDRKVLAEQSCHSCKALTAAAPVSRQYQRKTFETTVRRDLVGSRRGEDKVVSKPRQSRHWVVLRMLMLRGRSWSTCDENDCSKEVLPLVLKGGYVLWCGAAAVNARFVCNQFLVPITGHLL